MPKLQTENTVQSFEDILENRGQTRLFKVVTLGHELDNQEAEFLIPLLKNTFQRTKMILTKTYNKSQALPGFYYSNSTGMLLVYRFSCLSVKCAYLLLMLMLLCRSVSWICFKSLVSL